MGLFDRLVKNVIGDVVENVLEKNTGHNSNEEEYSSKSSIVNGEQMKFIIENILKMFWKLNLVNM